MTDINNYPDALQAKAADCAQSSRSAALTLESLAEQLSDPLARLLEDRCLRHADPPIADKLARQLSLIPHTLRDLACRQRSSFNRSLEILAELSNNAEILQYREANDGSPLDPPNDHELIKPVALIVDDEYLIREVVRELMEDMNYQVELAKDGREAWEILQTQTVDAVFLDFRMPLMHGFEVAELIKTLNDDERPRVIGITNSPLADEHKQARAKGMDSILVKPVTPEAIKLALARPTAAREGAHHQ